MNKQAETVLRKYAEGYLRNNREAMEQEDIAELETALGIEKSVSVLNAELCDLRIQLFQQYIEKTFNNLYPSGCTDEQVESWHSKEWTITFDGMSITIPNGAIPYNNISDMLKELQM